MQHVLIAASMFYLPKLTRQYVPQLAESVTMMQYAWRSLCRLDKVLPAVDSESCGWGHAKNHAPCVFTAFALLQGWILFTSYSLMLSALTWDQSYSTWTRDFEGWARIRRHTVAANKLNRRAVEASKEVLFKRNRESPVGKCSVGAGDLKEILK